MQQSHIRTKLTCLVRAGWRLELRVRLALGSVTGGRCGGAELSYVPRGADGLLEAIVRRFRVATAVSPALSQPRAARASRH